MNWHFLGQNMNRVTNSTVKNDTQTRSMITSAGWTTVSFLGTTGTTGSGVVVMFDWLIEWFQGPWIVENVNKSYKVPNSWRNGSCFETRNNG